MSLKLLAKGVIAGALVVGATFGFATAASASETYHGSKSCSSPWTVQTYSNSPAGNVYHNQNISTKSWTNTGTGLTYRTFNAGIQNADVITINSSTTLASAGSTCQS